MILATIGTRSKKVYISIAVYTLALITCHVKSDESLRAKHATETKVHKDIIKKKALS